jgi:hypothetical protein
LDSTDVIRHGLERAKWTVTELWVATLGISGAFSRHDVDQITGGQHPIEHNILAVALKDHFTGLGQDHPIPLWVGPTGGEGAKYWLTLLCSRFAWQQEPSGGPGHCR